MDGENRAADFRPLDPLRLELRGSRLIEASAGTGKTWTIAMLYLRLILGHGGQAPQPPSAILVLTFTEAAAQELRDRIRQRLAQAATLFAQLVDDAVPAPADPALLALCREFSPTVWRTCARTLDLAAQAMDEAAISTIHAWCARVLKEHAFVSGSLFDQQLETDQEERLHMLAWDYWRAQVACLPETPLAQVLEVWPQPDALLPLARGLTRAQIPSPADESLLHVFERAASRRRDALAALKAPWIRDADILQDWLLGLGADCAVRAHDVRRWMQGVKAWAATPDLEALDLKTGWARLSPSGLQEKWRGEGAAPGHALLEALSELPARLRELPSLRAPLVRHAMGWMAQRLQHSLRRDGVLGFDGLLTSLDAALQGPNGALLAQRLRAQFPAVLIDEFQDTDPVQYRIFDQIYRVADDTPDCALIFIGDPKQAIYGFRGADVHTYLRAARACGDRRYTLTCNFRASHALVAAVNHCFARCPVFPTGVAAQTIAFHPVSARGRDRDWVVDGAQATPLSASWIAPPVGDLLSVQAYRAASAAACAARIAALLAKGAAGRAGLRKGDELQPIRPADMAVLVNGRDEADAVRRALARRGLRSVYLSERESVFSSPQAVEIAACLQACAHPTEERAVRAALATPLLGLALTALDALVDDERAWDAEVERFRQYQWVWRRRGVLPMLRQLFNDFSVPARCLADADGGERRLTDCLHLAELLQQMSSHLDGPQALLRALHQQCAQPGGEDSRRLRLESDEALVRVVTIHKSKGLEYPLVFLPFACYAHSNRRFQGPQLLDENGVRVWVVEPDATQQAQLAGERLGEEVRKLYVALTRAQYAVWLGLGALSATANSGLGHVLGSDVREAWQDLVEEAPASFAWLDPAPEGDDEGRLSSDQAPLGPARRLARPVVQTPWWIASYSALGREAEAGDVPLPGTRRIPETAAEDVLYETEPADDRTSSVDVEDEAGPLAGFPRGSEAGTFLHGLLEWAARQHFRDLADARDMIARRCVVRGWEAHIDRLLQWLLDYVHTPWRLALGEQPVLQLDRVAACVPELEFWFPVEHVDIARLDHLITRGFFAETARPALARGMLNGLFKGFIDLTLQLDGRYYLMDYKSNDLGPRADDYGFDALVGAMCQARYDVQLLVYCLAVHRLLRARLPGYDYDRHMGGAVYHFLRGAHASGQGLLAWRPPASLIEALDALVRGAPRGDAQRFET